jgi:hypothetical protein
MNRTRVVNGIFVVLLMALAHVSGLAQETKEPYLEAAQRAGEAMRKGDLSAAIELYTEAVNLFPKNDAYTPKNRKIKLADGKFIETPYTGLESLYWSRGAVYLSRRNMKEAEIDFANALTVLKYDTAKNIEKAKSLRRRADIKKERENGRSTIYNSDLARSAFDFGVALDTCRKAKYFNQKRRRFYQELKMPLAPEEQNIRGFDEIVKYEEAAIFGRTEAQATLMIEVENKAYAFWALKSANEFIAAFPGNVEAYRLRARINRYSGREADAAADDQKAGQLSGQK